MATLTGEKLRIKFRKALRKQPTTNAELDPGAPLPVRLMMKSEEVVLVKVTRTNADHYWFTDRRLIGQGWRASIPNCCHPFNIGQSKRRLI